MTIRRRGARGAAARSLAGTYFSAVLAFAAPASQADMLHVVATGNVIDYSDPDGLMPWGAGPTTLSLTFRFDDQTPSYGSGYDIDSTGIMTGDGIPVPVAALTTLSMRNDWTYGDRYYDSWEYLSVGPDPNHPGRNDYFELRLSTSGSSPPGVLTDTSLIRPEWPGLWETGYLAYAILEWDPDVQDYHTRATVLADLTNLVVTPLPGAGLLFGSGLAGLMAGLARLRSRSST